jgi:Na+/H+-dicarboxylate symporter/ABC-type amino acid transport substrate-binding protein
MSSTTRIVVGLALGVVTGVVFGEHVKPLQIVADGFVRLLQMSVLPYVTVSLISSIGSLDPAHAKRLGLRLGLVIAGLWGVALVFALLFPLAFPAIQTASFFSSSMVERRPPFDLVSLYIPSNPFHSLANSVVPAVVLFSVMLGGGLIAMPRKRELIGLLEVIGAGLSRVTRFVIGLSPYGLFAIAAVTSGTIDVVRLQKIQLYLVTYSVMAAVITLWVLPGIVSVLTPIGRREMFALAHDALITAFMTGELFVVLPALIDASRQLLERHDVGPGAGALPDAIVPVSFNFPGVGKLLSLSFVLFAAWYADAPIALAQYPRLALTGLLTFFGSLSAAVPFLLDTFRVPADTFQLFVMTSVINSRVGTLIAAVHTMAVAIVGACAVYGAIQVDLRRLVRFIAITVILTAAGLGATRMVFGTVLARPYDRDQLVNGMGLSLSPSAQATVSATADAAPVPDAALPVLARLRAGGSLRVGFEPDRLPYSFYNQRGELVGLDVEMAHQLARELRVPLVFVPVESARYLAAIESGRCDILMAGVKVTPMRAAVQPFSAPYLDETLGLVVSDSRRDGFERWEDIRARGSRMRIAMQYAPYYGEKLRELLPEARIEVVNLGARELLAKLDAGYDAVALGAEMGSAWTLRYPRFSAVVPGPEVMKLPIAYVLPRGDADWMAFVNTWIMLKQRDGTIDGLYKYWILGQVPDGNARRWSVVHDVLGWD